MFLFTSTGQLLISEMVGLKQMYIWMFMIDFPPYCFPKRQCQFSFSPITYENILFLSPYQQQVLTFSWHVANLMGKELLQFAFPWVRGGWALCLGAIWVYTSLSLFISWRRFSTGCLVFFWTICKSSELTLYLSYARQIYFSRLCICLLILFMGTSGH